MRNFFRLAENVMTMPLVEQIVRTMDHAWEWGDETSYLRETQIICLRSPETFPPSPHEAVDTNLAVPLRAAKTMALDVMALVRGSRLGPITLLKLAPGAKVLPHDNSKKVYYTRYHVVLQGLPGAHMLCGNEGVPMKTGDIWWVNTGLEHTSINNSADDRLHMLVDVRVDP